MMKRTEKSIANSRQTRAEPTAGKANKDCDRDKAKYEEKYTTEEKLQQSIQSASQSRSIQEPMQMSSRSKKKS